MSERDVERFSKWAGSYDEHWLQPRFFGPVQRATLQRAALLCPQPRRILDVGCGTGALLRMAAEHFPTAELTGVDPARDMVTTARRTPGPDRSPLLVNAAAERLPFPDGTFDLVTSTVSFHHWHDQLSGLREIRRVLTPGGSFVLADMLAVSWIRLLFTIGRTRDRFHTRTEIEDFLHISGLTPGGFGSALSILGIPAVSLVWASS